MAISSNPADEPPLRGSTGTNARGETITFEVPSEMQSLEEVRRIVSGLLEQTRLTEREVKDMLQAVLEMAANAIEWGNGSNPALNIRIKFRADPDLIIFLVRDQGDGFEHYQNGRAMPSVEELMGKDGPIRMPNGFGIMLARGLVDKFLYNDRGNEVILIKRVGRVGS
jgi:anti-sigma regulatory factor (Ser/Thr protein kinase)